MKSTIVFIHGMFQNKDSWDKWLKYFRGRGYACIAESWPLHEGEPIELRANVPKGLGDLRLQEVIDHYEGLIRKHDTDAILIGHSVGGLVVQSLLSKGLGRAGVCISSVAPNRMLALDWGFFRNSISIMNPFKGDEPIFMTQENFYRNFGNTMTRIASDIAYDHTATHDSRNVLRDCMLEAGHIDLEQMQRPLLFIAAEKDQVIPPEINMKNSEAYREGLANYILFKDRGHFICGQPGWEEVAEYTDQWIIRHAVPAEEV